MTVFCRYSIALLVFALTARCHLVADFIYFLVEPDSVVIVDTETDTFVGSPIVLSNKPYSIKANPNGQQVWVSTDSEILVFAPPPYTQHLRLF